MMKSFKNFRISLPLMAVLAIVLGGLFFGMPVTASESKANKTKIEAPVPENGEAWAVRCQDVEASEGQAAGKYCETFQVLAIQQEVPAEEGKAAETKTERLIEFAVGQAEPKKLRGVVVLPLGITVEEPLEIEIDGKHKFDFRVRYCQPNGCYAFLNMSDSMTSRMEKGGNMVVKGQILNGQPIEIALSLKGFADTLKKAKNGGK